MPTPPTDLALVRAVEAPGIDMAKSPPIPPFLKGGRWGDLVEVAIQDLLSARRFFRTLSGERRVRVDNGGLPT